MAKWVKFVITLACLALIVGIFLQFKKGSVPVSGESIEIGFVGSLTGVDPDYGESMKNGLQMAVQEINESGGVLGRQMKVVYEDGTCTEGSKAAAAGQKLISVDRVGIIVDGSCSTGLLAYAPIAEKNKVLVISSGATADSVTHAGDYIFRNVPSSAIAGKVLANVVSRAKTVAILSENSDYASTLRGSFIATYGTDPRRLVVDESFSGTQKDFRTVLSKIKDKQPDAFVINPQAADTVVQIARQAREIGMNAQIYIAYFTSPAVLNAGSSTDGIEVVDLPTINQKETKAYSFLQKYIKQFGTAPPYQFSALLAYDAGYLLKQAIESTASTNPSLLKDYFSSMKTFDGAAGSYHFDENGDVVGISHSLKQIKNGQVITLIDAIN